MVFNYYNRLSAKNKRIYLASNKIEMIKLPEPMPLWPLARKLEKALETDKRAAVETVCCRLAEGMLLQLNSPPVNIKVMAARPANDYGELHGFMKAWKAGSGSPGSPCGCAPRSASRWWRTGVSCAPFCMNSAITWITNT